MKSDFDRRDFLRIVGCSTPFLLPIFTTLRANAQANAQKKLVFIHWSNGCTKAFKPRSFGNNFQSSYVLDGLKDHKADLNVLFELGTYLAKDVSHTAMNMLTGSQLEFADKPKGQSIDGYLGPMLNAPISSLKLNVDHSRKSTHFNTMCYNNNKQPITMIKNPRQAYDYTFKNFKFPNSTNEVPEIKNPQKLIDQKKSIVDLVRGDFQNLKRHLSSTELSKFESHFDLFRTFEKEIEKDITEEVQPEPAVVNSCKPLQMPSSGEDTDILSPLSIAKRSRLFNLISVAALACDRTHIVCLLASEGISAAKYPHLNGRQGLRLFEKSAHHPISHYYADDGCSDKVKNLGINLTDMEKMKTEIDKWYCEEMSFIVSRMKEFDIFKNSFVLAGNTMGANAHTSRKSSFVSAGNLGGFFKTNFAKDYKASTSNNHTAILAAILEGFGRKETFGYNAYRKPALRDIIA